MTRLSINLTVYSDIDLDCVNVDNKLDTSECAFGNFLVYHHTTLAPTAGGTSVDNKIAQNICAVLIFTHYFTLSRNV